MEGEKDFEHCSPAWGKSVLFYFGWSTLPQEPIATCQPLVRCCSMPVVLGSLVSLYWLLKLTSISWWIQIPFYPFLFFFELPSVGLWYINGLKTLWLIYSPKVDSRGTTDGHQDFRVAGVYCIDVNFIEDWERMWSEFAGWFAEKVGDMRSTFLAYSDVGVE